MAEDSKVSNLKTKSLKASKIKQHASVEEILQLTTSIMSLEIDRLLVSAKEKNLSSEQSKNLIEYTKTLLMIQKDDRDALRLAKLDELENKDLEDLLQEAQSYLKKGKDVK